MNESPASHRHGHAYAYAGDDVFFEAASVIVLLTLLGQVIEIKARSQTRSRGKPRRATR